MASAVSLEYLKSLLGADNGIATLDNDGLVPTSQLPPESASPFKGHYADEAELTTAYPLANIADYAYVDDSLSFWYWNDGLSTPAWVNQEIIEADYDLLSDLEKSMVPYLIVPDEVIIP